MSAAILLAAVMPAAALFAAEPMGETALAQVHAPVPAPALRSSGLLTLPRFAVAAAPLSTGEQIDNWWAIEGMAMIAEAVRPTPAVPDWLDPVALRDGGLAIQLDVRLVATTRP